MADIPVYRFEVALKPHVSDARGEAAAAGIRNFLGLPVDAVRTRSVYKVAARLSPDEADRVRREFTDPVTQDSSMGRHPAPECDWVITVGFQPGVTDNVGRSAKTAIEDVVGRKLGDDEAVFTETQYFLQAPQLTRGDAQRIGTDLLANELIERIRVQSAEEHLASEPDLELPLFRGDTEPRVREYDLNVSDEELMRISQEGTLALSLEEMKAIQQYFALEGFQQERAVRGLGPNPTDVELECLAQTWSEHCKHKIFNAVIEYRDAETGETAVIDSLFDTYVRRATEELKAEKEWLVSVFRDNAGVIRFNEKWNLVFKVETHNSPSALDPYGGAMTGIVGVNRDPFGTGLGAALVANVWGYCLGSPFYDGELPEGLLHPRRIRDGVHKGVIDGGNQSGIPYMRGWEIFDDRYLGKPLVFCGTVGVQPVEVAGRPAHEKSCKRNDYVVMVGGRIGKDGIHGATFSSEELHGQSPAQAVQIGDPITQKKMTDFLLEARDLGLYTCITDNGAGGLSSSVGETAQLAGGVDLELSNAPLKYEGLQPWEILLSEAQERMTVATPPEHLDAFMELAERRDVEATVMGYYTDLGKFRVFYQDKLVAYLDMDFLHDGLPRMRLEAVWEPPQHEEPDLEQAPPVAESLPGMLAQLNLCSGEKKARQYDHEVKGRSVVKPYVGVRADTPSDASVMLVDYESREGFVLSEGVNPHWSDIDTYHMAASVIDLAVRRVIATGGTLDYLAGLDNFCWPDPVQSEKTPDGRYKLAQLVRCCRGLYDYTKAYGAPLISGKDSMKNDSTRGGRKISVPPTLLFSLIGKIEDVTRAVTLDVKAPGDAVFVLGVTRAELGGSEYYRYLGERARGEPFVGRRVPTVDADALKPLYRWLEQAIARGLVRSAHAPGKGGLGVGLAKCAFGGELGLDVDLRLAPQEDGLRDDELLYSESSGRFIVTTAADDAEEFERLMAGLPCAAVGRVREDTQLRFVLTDGSTACWDVLKLKSIWKEPLNAI